jgi:hypothetical protein
MTSNNPIRGVHQLLVNYRGILSLAVMVMFCIAPSTGQAKEPDTTLPVKRNVISYNLTAPVLFGWDNVVFGYERVVKKNQSFSIMIGYRGFPEIIDPDSSWLIDNYKKDGGFSASADYRFYLTKRNKSHIPDGIYIGPYVNYYTSSFTYSATVIENEDVVNYIDASADLTTAGLGFELGYQFVFWDKMTLDLVLLGPGYAWYSAKLDLKGEFSIDEESELYQKLLELSLGNFDFLKIVDQEFKATGSGRTSKLGLGYRYLIRIGWYF